MVDIKLVQALNSKICHDFANSIGTLDTCIGMLDHEDSSIRKKAKELLAEESANLVKKVKNSRAIYGFRKEEEESNTNEIRDILIALFDHKPGLRTRFNLTNDTIKTSLDIIKVTCCLALIASENIMHKGGIDISVLSDLNNLITVEATGEKVFLRDEMAEIITDKKEHNISSMNSREQYIKTLCKSKNFAVSIDFKKNSIKYSVKSI